MIAVIVPFSRPQMTNNVLANFKRQRFPTDTILIIVENGPAIDTWKPSLWIQDYVVQSQHGRSHARTAGLHKARELGCEWYSFLDDDDIWGAGFLEFMWERRELADVIGFYKHILEDPTGKHWMIQYAEKAGLRVPKLHPSNLVGGIAPSSMFGRLSRAVDWTAHVPFSEEIFWMTAMYRAGRTLYGLEDPDPENNPLYILKRYADPAHGHALGGNWQKEVGDGLQL